MPKTQKIVHTVCTYCGVGCDVAVALEGEQIKRFFAKEGGKVSRGKLCIKGKEGWSYLFSPKRVNTARVKKSYFEANRELFSVKNPKTSGANERYYDISYEEAYDALSKKILMLLKERGAHSMAGVGGARCSCEGAYAFQRFVREVLGSPHIDCCARVCHSPSLAGLRRTVGEGAASNPFDDILKAEFLLVIGSNTTEAHPIVANRVLDASKAGTTLAVVDVRDIQLSKKANFNLIIPYESNLLFLNMLAFVILKEKLYNKEFIKKRAVGFEEYRDKILNDKFADPDFFSSIKGYENLSIKIKEVARIYAKSRSMILWGLGITEHLDGSAAVSAIANLALMTGNIGQEGAGLMPLRGQNNVQGACDMGCLPYFAPDYSKPKEEGLKSIDLFDEALKGNVSLLYNMGEDLTHIHANLSKVEEAISKIDTIVVHEVVEADMTNRGDFVFGVKSAYEKKGVYTNAERRVQLSVPVVHSSLPDDWEIIDELTKRVCDGMAFESQDRLWSEATSKIKRYAFATYETLFGSDGLQWPVSQEGDTPRLYEKSFRTDDGKGRFYYEPYSLRGHIKELLDSSCKGFWLTTGRIIAHYNNAAQTKLSEKLKSSYVEDVVLVSHEDAKRFDLSKRAVLISKNGRSAPLKLKESGTVKKGTLYTTFHYPESKINYLFGDEGDAITKTSRFKAVKVELVQNGQ